MKPLSTLAKPLPAAPTPALPNTGNSPNGSPNSVTAVRPIQLSRKEEEMDIGFDQATITPTINDDFLNLAAKAVAARSWRWLAGMRGLPLGYQRCGDCMGTGRLRKGACKTCAGSGNGALVKTAPTVVFRGYEAAQGNLIGERLAGLWWFWPDTDCFGARADGLGKKPRHEHPAYLPDVNDAATKGGMLQLVREATGDDTAAAICCEGMDAIPPMWTVMGRSGGYGEDAKTEGGALVNALLAAGVR